MLRRLVLVAMLMLLGLVAEAGNIVPTPKKIEKRGEAFTILTTTKITHYPSLRSQAERLAEYVPLDVREYNEAEKGNIVLRDRQHLAEDGIMIVVLTLEKYSNQLLAGPDIVSRGFVYVRESEDLMEDARCLVEEAVDNCLNRGVTDWGKMKGVIKDSLGGFIWKRTKRNPMILPIIMEV